MMNKKPNFFLVGAPKCGTTSLATWLSEHPNIYMSPVKEPHFFNTDQSYIGTHSQVSYENLFSQVKPSHKAIGEASVFYLYSREAVPNIESALPNSRYIVMLRNPVEMAPSLHEQQVFALNEHIKDFEEAWHKSEKRLLGTDSGKFCRDPQLLAYKSVCALGEQLQNLLAIVPRERVLIVFLDDVKQDTRREYLRILDFLGISDDQRQSFPVENMAKARRWPWLRVAVRYLNDSRRNLGIPRLGSGLMGKIEKANRVERVRLPLNPVIKKELIEHFRSDIQLIEKLTDRDLSHWVKT